MMKQMSKTHKKRSGMSPKEYLSASERTEKKFPDGAVLEINSQVVLGIVAERLNRECGTLDKVKRNLIYGAECEATAGKLPEGLGDLTVTSFQMEMLHAAIGKMTEAEEFFDMVIKHVLDGDDFDKANAIEEVGDGMWYDAIVLRLLGMTSEDAASINILKLFKRFPDQFDSELAMIRNLDAERKVLDDGVGEAPLKAEA